MFYSWFQSNTRYAADGIKARSKRGQIGERWWSRRFIEALEQFADSKRLSRGRTYARHGQVLNLEIEPGVVKARVQGSRRTPYKVEIGFEVLPEAIWGSVEEALAEETVALTELLAGTMPQSMEQIFQRAGVALFPSRSRDLSLDCSCPDWGNPCKHAAAVCYLLAERFDEDPALIFTWRGRAFDVIVEHLQEKRAGGVDTAPLDDASPSGFWGSRVALAGFSIDLEPPSPPEQALLQLGPAGVKYARKDLSLLLAPAYAALTAGAIEQAGGDEAWRPLAVGRRRQPPAPVAAAVLAAVPSVVPAVVVGSRNALGAMDEEELIAHLDAAYDQMSHKQREFIFGAYGAAFGKVDLGDEIVDMGEVWRDKEALFDLLVDEPIASLRMWLRLARV